MVGQADPRPLSASTDVTASPRAVWDVVSDVRRTGEWSPECTRVVPLGALRVGTLLFGVNRRKRVQWVTVSRINSYSPSEEIGWVVLTNGAEWRYQRKETASGTAIMHTRRTPRGEGRFALGFTRALLGGQAVHDDELEHGMALGLQRIKAIVEAGDAGQAGVPGPPSLR